MEICWDNLEKLKYNKKKHAWYTKNYTKYVYMDSCYICNYPYLTINKNRSKFCGNSCSTKGRTHTEETKKKISNSRKGKHKGKENNLWKGGVTKKNIPLYDTFAYQINYIEQVRRNKKDKNILEVKCTYCGKWHIPKSTDLWNRIKSLNGKSTNGSEARLYCSNECKIECPIYRRHYYSAEEVNSKQYSREVQPELRQMVFKRDDYMCQKCFSVKSLHCHHIEGIRWESLESADIDKCITYCKDCHKEVHKKEYCRYIDMQCKETT